MSEKLTVQSYPKFQEAKFLRTYEHVKSGHGYGQENRSAIQKQRFWNEVYLARFSNGCLRLNNLLHLNVQYK